MGSPHGAACCRIAGRFRALLLVLAAIGVAGLGVNVWTLKEDGAVIDYHVRTTNDVEMRPAELNDVELPDAEVPVGRSDEVPDEVPDEAPVEAPEFSTVAVCFLTTTAPESLVKWAVEIALSSGASGLALDVYIMEDAPVAPSPRSFKEILPARVTLLDVPAEVVLAANFTGMTKVAAQPGGPSAWDKAIYAFVTEPLAMRHELVWFIEDDVFVSTVPALVALSQRALAYDFVSPPTMEFDGNSSAWHGWEEYQTLGVPKPWRAGMMCMVAMSRTFLKFLGTIPAKWSHFLYLEAMLPTLAAHASNVAGLKTWEPSVLYTVEWRHNNGSWNLPDIISAIRTCPTDDCSRFFHPVKDTGVHPTIRETLHQASLS